MWLLHIEAAIAEEETLKISARTKAALAAKARGVVPDANGRSKIEERLARWLLMAADRVEGELALTLEFLSITLGVRRSGVTTALQELERSAPISHRRGFVTILDREIAHADAATGVIPLIYFLATDASRSAHARPTPQFVSFAPGKPVQPPFSRKLPRS